MIKFKRIFVLGRPLCGKSTQCALLSKKYNIKHFSIGIELRKILNDVNVDQKFKDKINNLMLSGKLLSDEDKLLLFGNIFKQCDETVIFDGFPRALSDVFNGEPYNNKIDCFILIFADINTSIERSKKRLYCKQCSYTTFQIDKSKYMKCKKCNIFLSKRSDDNLEILKKRMMIFINQQNKVIKLLHKRNIVVHKVLSTTITKTFSDIENILLN